MQALSCTVTLICLCFIIVLINTKTLNGQIAENERNKSVISAGLYSKIFVEHRREQKIVIKNMVTSNNYEKNYKMLKLTYGKIYKLIKENNLTIAAYAYEALRDGFDENGGLQVAVSILMENCCIAAESLIHFPEISYRIFGKPDSEWKMTLNWCYEFVNSFPHIIDESTSKLMLLLFQEINEENRHPDYVNPYYDVHKHQGKQIKKKRYKKLKNGPSLSRGKTEL